MSESLRERVVRAASAIAAFRADDEQMWLSHEDAIAAQEALEAAAEALRGSGWQPIATAPKDGTEVLTWGPVRGIDTAAYRDDPAPGYEWICTSTTFSMDHEAAPTHWQPLPAPSARGEG